MVGGCVVGGVILDESVLFAEALNLKPGAEPLLRRMRHSGLRTGITYGSALSSHKVTLIKRVATLYSIDCFVLDKSSTDDAVSQIMQSWHDITGSILYLVSDSEEEMFCKVSNCNWLITILRDDYDAEGGGKCESSKFVNINKLDQLPMVICHLNKKAVGKSIVTVGYMMKSSREEDFAKRGAFPMYPTYNGLMFFPITFELPLGPQLEEADIILHKGTDEILSIELSGCSRFPSKITYTEGMSELKRYMDNHVDCCVVDPLSNICPVLNRLEIQHILLGLKDLKSSGSHTIRAPHFLKVDNFVQPDFSQQFFNAKLHLPSIVKPQVACGVADAHSMAIVFKLEDFKGLSVPLPAVIQEYVDHSSTLYKFYILGEKVFYAVKKSTPNIDALMKLSGSECKPLIFDSLKSLPIENVNQNTGDGDCSIAAKGCIDHELVTDAAKWLMRNLGLTIFGFDVVIQEGTGDHVVVDLNYLPSFKEVPDDDAIPAFWEAIKRKFEMEKLT